MPPKLPPLPDGKNARPTHKAFNCVATRVRNLIAPHGAYVPDAITTDEMKRLSLIGIPLRIEHQATGVTIDPGRVTSQWYCAEDGKMHAQAAVRPDTPSGLLVEALIGSGVTPDVSLGHNVHMVRDGNGGFYRIIDPRELSITTQGNIPGTKIYHQTPTRTPIEKYKGFVGKDMDTSRTAVIPVAFSLEHNTGAHFFNSKRMAEVGGSASSGAMGSPSSSDSAGNPLSGSGDSGATPSVTPMGEASSADIARAAAVAAAKQEGEKFTPRQYTEMVASLGEQLPPEVYAKLMGGHIAFVKTSEKEAQRDAARAQELQGLYNAFKGLLTSGIASQGIDPASLDPKALESLMPEPEAMFQNSRWLAQTRQPAPMRGPTGYQPGPQPVKRQKPEGYSAEYQSPMMGLPAASPHATSSSSSSSSSMSPAVSRPASEDMVKTEIKKMQAHLISTLYPPARFAGRPATAAAAVAATEEPAATFVNSARGKRPHAATEAADPAGDRFVVDNSLPPAILDLMGSSGGIGLDGSRAVHRDHSGMRARC